MASILYLRLKKKLLQLLKIIIPISLGLYLVAHIYNQLDDEQRQALFESFEQANYFWIVLSVFMGISSHVLRGYRWRFQLEAMGYDTSVFNNFMAVMIGYIVNMILPRVGEISRGAAITKYEKVPFQKSFGSILSERALDLVVLLLIGILTIVLQYELLKDFAEALFAKIQETAGSPIFWIVLIVGLLLLFALYLVLRRFKHVSAFSKFHDLIHGLLEGLRSLFLMKKRWVYLGATLGIWGLYLGMFWICFFSLEATSHLGPNAIFAGFVMGSFAVVLIPGGIGAYPVAIMQSLLLYGIAESTGFALGWIIWLSQTAMIVFFGGLCMIYMPIFNKKRNYAIP